MAVVNRPPKKPTEIMCSSIFELVNGDCRAYDIIQGALCDAGYVYMIATDSWFPVRRAAMVDAQD